MSDHEREVSASPQENGSPSPEPAGGGLPTESGRAGNGRRVGEIFGVNRETVREALPVVAVVAVLFSFAVSYFSQSPRGTGLEVVAALVPRADGASWILRGRVLQQGSPLATASVWAVTAEARGNRDSPKATETDNNGSFVIEPVPFKIGDSPVTEVTIHALEKRYWILARLGAAAKGEETLFIGTGGLRRVRLSGWAMAFLPVTFVLSVLLPFVGGPARGTYLALLALAVVLTAGMLLAISLGLSDISTGADKDEVLSLGFASLFRGRYVDDVEPEWLFSLTAPREKAPAAPQTTQPAPGAEGARADQKKPGPALRGFGAPLWVLLLAVIGAGLMTVSLIVSEISNRPDFTDAKKVRDRMEVMVRHQFFILFSPLGAVFVYQMLVAANTASQPLAVAIAALGAGPILNALLNKAVTTAQGLLLR